LTICFLALSLYFSVLSLRLFLSSSFNHSSFSLASDTLDAIFSQLDKRAYHKAHAVHQTISIHHFQNCFHHSATFLHDCLALSKASRFVVIL
jgi:hypothetical protein